MIKLVDARASSIATLRVLSPFGLSNFHRSSKNLHVSFIEPMDFASRGFYFSQMFFFRCGARILPRSWLVYRAIQAAKAEMTDGCAASTEVAQQAQAENPFRMGDRKLDFSI